MLMILLPPRRLFRINIFISQLASLTLSYSRFLPYYYSYPQKLGIGTVWKSKGLATKTSACTYKADSKATSEWRCLTGCSNTVPLEKNICGHFDETCLNSELLTPYTDKDMRLSRITVASLEDIGYLVNYNGADVYTSAQVATSCRCNRRLGQDSRNPFRRPEQQERELQFSDAQVAALNAAISYGKQELRQKLFSAADFFGSENVTSLPGAWISVFYADPDTGSVEHTIVRAQDLQ
jgi:hypothetical protein